MAVTAAESLAKLDAEIEAVDGDDPTNVDYHHWQTARAKLRRRFPSVQTPQTINPPPNNIMPTEIKIPMHRDKECKGSVRFVSHDEKAPVTNVYVSRDLAGVNEAQQVTIVVAIGG